MKVHTTRKKAASALRCLIPVRFAYLFEYRPLLWFEQTRHYDQLLADTLAEFAPTSLIEYNWIKELVDTQWELLRLHKMKKVAVQSQLPDLAVEHLHDDFKREAPELALSGEKIFLKRIAQMANHGIKWSQKTIGELMLCADLNYDELLFESYQASMATLGVLDAKLARAEQRRDDLIEKFEKRRQMLAAMQASLASRRPRDEIIDVVPVESSADAIAESDPDA